jgi:general stress protein 26
MSLKENILKVTGGECVAALATIQEGKPAVRFMALFGLDDLTLIGATSKSSRKVEQIKRDPEVALTIWSGKSFGDPYVMIQGKCSIYEDLETKKKFWNPKMEVFYQKPENPEYVVLKFVPKKIEFYHHMTMEVLEE